MWTALAKVAHSVERNESLLELFGFVLKPHTRFASPASAHDHSLAEL